MALLHDTRLAQREVAHRDRSLRDDGQRPRAGVGHRPLRPADRRRAVATAGAEAAARVPEDAPLALARGGAALRHFRLARAQAAAPNRDGGQRVFPALRDLEPTAVEVARLELRLC